MRIGELLASHRGMDKDEIEQELEKYKEKKVYELMVIKDELGKYKEFPDVSCMKWFRGDEQ